MEKVDKNQEEIEEAEEITNKLELGVRTVIYTWSNITAFINSDHSVRVNTKNMRDVKFLFDVTEYNFEKMSLREIIETLIKELTLFIEETEQVGQQEIEDFLWVFMFEILDIYIEIEENPDKEFFKVASEISNIFESLEKGDEDYLNKILEEKKEVYDLIMKEFETKEKSEVKNLLEDFEGDDKPKDMFKKREGGRKKKKKNAGFVNLMADIKEEVDKEKNESDDDDDIPKPSFTMPEGGTWSKAN